jgi:elongation factor Ts
MTMVTPNMIKELRERTGIGMGKCKQALEEAGGDIEKAISNLRKAGMATAVKKEGRDTNEGIISAKETDDSIGIVEVAAETDFVIQNDKFQEFVKMLADEVAATKPADLNAFLTQKSTIDPNATIDELRAHLIQAIGENIQIKRVLSVPKEANTSYGVYSHLGGKILTLITIQGSSDEAELARGIAMHTAAASPDYLNPEAVPADIIESEKDIARTQVKGKPENIIDKIIEGKLNAFYDQSCLTNQKYIRDDSKTINAIIDAKAKETGKLLKLTSFIRWSK